MELVVFKTGYNSTTHLPHTSHRSRENFEASSPSNGGIQGRNLMTSRTPRTYHESLYYCLPSTHACSLHSSLLGLRASPYQWPSENRLWISTLALLALLLTRLGVLFLVWDGKGCFAGCWDGVGKRLDLDLALACFPFPPPFCRLRDGGGYLSVSVV